MCDDPAEFLPSYSHRGYRQDERQRLQDEDRAFNEWLEMAAKTGRQNPEQLMPSISGIVDDMNNMRAGKSFRCRAASDFAWAMENIRSAEVWLHVQGVVPLKAVCRAFMEGREATTFQPITVRGNQPISLDQVANLSHSELAGLLRDYLGCVSSLLPQAQEPSDKQVHAQTAIIHLTKEATMLRLAHVIGQPSHMHTYAEQKSASVPSDCLKRVIEVGAFTEEQARQMWDCWYMLCASMIHLKAQEFSLQNRAQTASNQAAASPECKADYCNLLITAAELKRNLEQQANLVFRFNCQFSMTILTPWQARTLPPSAPTFHTMHPPQAVQGGLGLHPNLPGQLLSSGSAAIMCQEAVSPSPFRPHLLFLSGVFPQHQPSPSRVPVQSGVVDTKQAL